MKELVSYRFEAHTTDKFRRATIEEGQTYDWEYIRTRPISMAREMNTEIYTIVWNEFLKKWEHVGTMYPNGEHYDGFGNGPSYYDPKSGGFHKKKGGDK